MIIVITGTCAVGKSTIASLLEKRIKGKVRHIHADRIRFENNSSHSHFQARKAHRTCCEKAKQLVSKKFTAIIQGNYIFRDLKRIYGNEVYYIHLNASLPAILSRHFKRKKKHPLSMIIGSWFMNYFLFRRTLNTTKLSEEETVDAILRDIYKAT